VIDINRTLMARCHSHVLTSSSAVTTSVSAAFRAARLLTFVDDLGNDAHEAWNCRRGGNEDVLSQPSLLNTPISWVYCGYNRFR